MGKSLKMLGTSMTKDFHYVKISCHKIFSNDIKNKISNLHYISACGGLKISFQSYSHFENMDV